MTINPLAAQVFALILLRLPHALRSGRRCSAILPTPPIQIGA